MVSLETLAALAAAATGATARTTEAARSGGAAALLLCFTRTQWIIVAQQRTATAGVIPHGVVAVEKSLQHLVDICGIRIAQVPDLDHLSLRRVGIQRFDHLCDLGHQAGRRADHKGGSAPVGNG